MPSLQVRFRVNLKQVHETEGKLGANMLVGTRFFLGELVEKRNFFGSAVLLRQPQRESQTECW